MFGVFPPGNFAAASKIDPRNIPPPTPVNIPRYQPFFQDGASADQSQALPNLLKFTGRSTINLLGISGCSALGLDLTLEAKPDQLLPDPSSIPPFREWEDLTVDEAEEKNLSTRRPLSNGKSSPGCQVYLERMKELSIQNPDGFRTVRRIPPPKGKQQARLGNAYEFFRCLETLTTYWDDPTQPPDMPPSPEVTPAEGKTDLSDKDKDNEERNKVLRTAAGQTMPADYRQNLLFAFVKLIAYDFGCNVSMARAEPRLQLSSPQGYPSPRKSYCASVSGFIFQSPTSREAARAGLVCGPVAAASARQSTDFTTPDVETAQSLDLARELVAALIAAQHRRREGKKEVRFGHDQWWTSKHRWGGGSGGPIGRESDRLSAPGDKETKPVDVEGMPVPVVKKPRKNMSIYDNYRMVRPPASTWDRKTQYEAIGKLEGSGYDDIFVVSSLFHHISLLRVRVPTRLLDVLEGAHEEDLSQRSWGKVSAWRSPWYDFFIADERVEAMKLVWAMMAYQMRQKQPVNDDITMGDA